MRHITVDEDHEWDDEVDVVCTDTAFGGLATAIATSRAGGTVLLASSSGTLADAEWFTPDFGEAETATYLHELTADIELETLPRASVDLPIRLVRTTRRADAAGGRRIATFDGALLREWAMSCIPARSGYLYTRVTDWDTTALESADGRPLAVAEIGAMAPDVGDVGGSVRRWLNAEVRDCAVSAQPVTGLERLVFADGAVVGAEFATVDGPLSVRARHGVLVCRPVEPLADPVLPDGAELRVALVGNVASRFGRVELLTSDPTVAATAGTCLPMTAAEPK